MNAAGIVVEYNPFHNGHLYHINETRRLSNADTLIAVMSGSFLQRGEPALVDKWTRTAMALHHGVDVVVELPYVFSTQKAETFAKGAIQILHHLHCQSFCFGSEDGRIEPFLETEQKLHDHKKQLGALIRAFMKEGISYPAAQTKARHELFGEHGLPLDLSKPNNILGFHYVQENTALGSPLMPLSVLRKGAGFHDMQAAGSIASATAIRSHLFSNRPIDGLMPDQAASLLSSRPLHSWEHYWPLLRYRLISMPTERLAAIYEVEEGIEGRLIQAALQNDSFHSFMEQVKTKRYTWTRLQRMMTHILTDTDKATMQSHEQVSYIRLLGMTETGRAYIRSIKKELAVPLISRTASGRHLLELDVKASRVYAAASGIPEHDTASLLEQEFSRPPLLL
ncbi:nucleotidyltransferase [Domibacillus enclensis]|uniref:tRNA(Met) cytidine acetate ligase n=1 Tax=Domibacillus enclensis TaxID=1017273 RepID=A0A1N6U7W7_9BACI|nr:nucleotidyltransferase [Domibacillus enclensis]OXS78457.1 hypothetical protein B1B05_07585 [Domibacillus enclensis]SIQ61705.1 Predicted nucleotidyltransferase [Domibacillus enclensis]